jgi:hypothetical protein
MGQVLDDGGTGGGVRALARVAEPFHSVTYYSRELEDFTDEGYRGWWHAYFAYRPAPMGAVPAGVVTAAFYNFAPRMVERAVPAVWQVKTPAGATAMRLERVERALARIFGDVARRSIAEAADLVRLAVSGCDVAGRPLYAAYAELDWPADARLALWHGCTLLREHRGDSHNFALAAADLDGVASHVLMAGRGHGNRATILAIRGWNGDEWDDALRRMVERGWARADGSLTASGREARSGIERHTDALASAPARRLGPDGLQRLVDLLTPLVGELIAGGEVPGRWPPPHVLKQDASG